MGYEIRYDFQIKSHSDERLLGELKELSRLEHRNLSRFLAYIQEVELRGIHLEMGYPYLTPFLQEILGYSEDEAEKRRRIATLARKYPLIYYYVDEGEITLTALCRLSSHLTWENHERILNLAKNKSVREVERLIAQEFPKAERPDRVRKTALPLSIDRFSIQFTTDEEGVGLLEKAKSLLSHQFPDGKLGDIYKAALKVLIEKLEPKQKPAPRRVEDKTIADPIAQWTPRYIPKPIRAEALKNANTACEYKSPDGHVCGSKKFLEFDHVLEWSKGGSSHQAENIRVLCRAHHQWRHKKESLWSSVG